nr:MAG TPA: hypothetical protein [Caudoviricetes sp.]
MVSRTSVKSFMVVTAQEVVPVAVVLRRRRNGGRLHAVGLVPAFAAKEGRGVGNEATFVLRPLFGPLPAFHAGHDPVDQGVVRTDLLPDGHGVLLPDASGIGSPEPVKTVRRPAPRMGALLVFVIVSVSVLVYVYGDICKHLISVRLFAFAIKRRRFRVFAGLRPGLLAFAPVQKFQVLLPVFGGRVSSHHVFPNQFVQPGPDFLFGRGLLGEAQGSQNTGVAIVQAEVVGLHDQAPEEPFGFGADRGQRLADDDRFLNDTAWHCLHHLSRVALALAAQFAAVLAKGIVALGVADRATAHGTDGTAGGDRGCLAALGRSLGRLGRLRCLGLCLCLSAALRVLAASLAALVCLLLNAAFAQEADVPEAVDDRQVHDLAAVVVADLRDGELDVRIGSIHVAALDLFDLPFTVVQFDIGERGGIQFAADPDVEAGAFEGVGRLSLFFLRVALDADVLFLHPSRLFVVPDFDRTEQVPVDQFVGSLPVTRPEDLVQDSHIDTGVLVEKKDRADRAVLRLADGLDATVDVFSRQKGNVEVLHADSSLLDLKVLILDQDSAGDGLSGLDCLLDCRFVRLRGDGGRHEVRGKGAFVVNLNLGGLAEADLRPGRFDLVAADGQHGGRQKVLQALDALFGGLAALRQGGFLRLHVADKGGQVLDVKGGRFGLFVEGGGKGVKLVGVQQFAGVGVDLHRVQGGQEVGADLVQGVRHFAAPPSVFRLPVRRARASAITWLTSSAVTVPVERAGMGVVRTDTAAAIFASAASARPFWAWYWVNQVWDCRRSKSTSSRTSLFSTRVFSRNAFTASVS